MPETENATKTILSIKIGSQANVILNYMTYNFWSKEIFSGNLWDYIKGSSS